METFTAWRMNGVGPVISGCLLVYETPVRQGLLARWKEEGTLTTVKPSFVVMPLNLL